MIQTIQVQGRRYSKPLKTYEKNITQKTEQSLVSENTLSTNRCKTSVQVLFVQNHSKLLYKK